MSDFKKAFHQYKTSLAFSLFNGGEKSRVPKILDDIDRHEYLAQSMFEAAQQSMQAKIDELQKRIDEYEDLTTSIRNEFNLWTDGREFADVIEAQIENLEAMRGDND